MFAIDFCQAFFLISYSLLLYWDFEKTKRTSTLGIPHTNNADLKMIKILFSLNDCAFACARLKWKWLLFVCVYGKWEKQEWLVGVAYILLSSFCHHHLMLCFWIYLYFLLQLFGKWIWIVCLTIYFLIAVNFSHFADISCRI